tara:strand:- start:280 stop:441 length:162 start_codon:yes stop_codon:yes gene_type:complete
MFIWQSLKPKTLATVLAAMRKARNTPTADKKKADAHAAANLRFANPCDPNSLT